MKQGKNGELSQMKRFGQQDMSTICKQTGHNKRGCKKRQQGLTSEVNSFL